MDFVTYKSPAPNLHENFKHGNYNYGDANS